MTPLDRVKEICKERKIPISRLERDCGFSNGYIRNLREGTLSAERTMIVAKYLGVSTTYLMTGEEDETGYYLNPETAKIAQEMFEDKEIRSLFHMKRNMDPDKFAAH